MPGFTATALKQQYIPLGCYWRLSTDIAFLSVV